MLCLKFVAAHADFAAVVVDDDDDALHVLPHTTLMLALLFPWKLLLFQPAMFIVVIIV